MRAALLITLLLSSLAFATSGQGVVTVASPDGSIELRLAMEGADGLSYSVQREGRVLIQPSPLGLRTEVGDLTTGTVGEARRSEVDVTWRPLYGQRAVIRNHHREAILPVVAGNGWRMEVVFRVFNDGVAFRYVIPKQEGRERLILTGEATEFRFGGDHRSLTIQYDVERERFEAMKPLSQSEFSLSPMLIDAGGTWLALNEAAIYGMSQVHFVNPDGRTAMRADIGRSEVTLPARTPWRVIQIGDRAGDIIESTVVANLNEPCDAQEFTWVRPGKSAWEHRTIGAEFDGFTYSRDIASYHRLIDFAAASGIEYIHMEGGWYTDEGPLHPRPERAMPAMVQYARERGVGSILYMDRMRARNWDLEQVLQMLQSWGVAGIKYGFLSNEMGFQKRDIDRAAFVRRTREIVELCAKYKMLVNFHDRPVQPGGEYHTWPNLIVQEYGKAQQDGPPRPGERKMDPRWAVSIPFMIGLNGGHDMANGFYDLHRLAARSTCDPLGMDSTMAAETARCLVNYSSLLVLPDAPEAYQAKADLFEFVRLMPDTWDQSRVLAGEPCEFIVVARRAGDSWFVAGYTNESGREYELALDFLGDGTYDATLYLDDKDTHYLTQKETYRIERRTASRQDLIRVALAPGGGFCARFQPREGAVTRAVDGDGPAPSSLSTP